MKAEPRTRYRLGAALLGVVLLLIALVCPSCGGNTAEAPGAGPLLSLLEGIPQDPITQADDFVYFVDYSAMESAYDATRPANAEEFTDLPDDVAHNVWWAVFRGNAWSITDYWLPWLESGPETVGFSPLDVDQAIRFGAPPGDGLMLAGSFDTDAIGAAYQANMDLAPQDFDGTTVWLWGDDPEGGLLVDTSSVVQENPFGGYLGRRQPMIISDDLLMSSADLDVVLAHVGAAAGTVPNLADAPGYRAAVDAVSEDAAVLQAAIAGPAMALGLQEAPVFQMLIVADVVTSDEQIARLGLVYPDAGSAESAAPVLLDRLSTYESLSGGQSFAETLAPPDGTGQRTYVREQSDCAVLVLEFPAPRATSEEIVRMLSTAAYDGNATPPGLVYRRLLTMFSRRDTSWLSAAYPD